MYKIRVKSIEGSILTFTKVKEYSTQDGLIEFIDSFNGKTKIFSTLQCEIEEEER